MLAWILNLGFAAGGRRAPSPPVGTSVPGGSSRRRGSIWEPSVALAIAAAQEDRRLWREAQEAARPKPKAHAAAVSAISANISAKASTEADLLLLTLEAVQLAIERADSDWLRQALRVVQEEEQRRLVALAKEEDEAARELVLLLMGARSAPVSDEEAAAVLMNMLMTVAH